MKGRSGAACVRGSWIVLFEWDFRDPNVVFVDGVAVPVGALDVWLRNDGYERRV